MKTGDKVKELRLRHGFSQEELAKQTQLSLRTVQRLEQGETEAQGDTLRRLARVFELKPAELIGQIAVAENNLVPILNLSALSFIIYPALGFIVPLVLWYFKRDGSKELDEAGKRLVNFQATWTLAVATVYSIGMLSKVLHIGGAFSLYLYLILPYLFYTVNFIFIVVNTVRSRNLKAVVYKPAIPFFKIG